MADYEAALRHRQWSNQNISVHGLPQRTNNAVESFHRDLMRMFGRPHPNIGAFTEKLQRVEHIKACDFLRTIDDDAYEGLEDGEQENNLDVQSDDDDDAETTEDMVPNVWQALELEVGEPENNVANVAQDSNEFVAPVAAQQDNEAENSQDVVFNVWQSQGDDQEFEEHMPVEMRCSVCLGNKKRYALNCGHSFCGSCTERLYDRFQESTCAICRSVIMVEPLPIDDDAYEGLEDGEQEKILDDAETTEDMFPNVCQALELEVGEPENNVANVAQGSNEFVAPVAAQQDIVRLDDEAENSQNVVSNVWQSQGDDQEFEEHMPIEMRCSVCLGNKKRRRPRKDENITKLRDHSYQYKIRIKEEGSESLEEVEVCQKAFIVLHGIINRRIITIKNYLKRKGYSGNDQRRKHRNRPHKMKQETYENIRRHIQSFKGRTAHYSLKKTKKLIFLKT
ncbi:hypothetical protein CBL_10549 [Carabus blaptoides fortunei]